MQEFLRTCLEVDMVQGFTMTEATCCGTLQPVGCKQVVCFFAFVKQINKKCDPKMY